MKSFDSMVDGITISFKCPYCGSNVQHEMGYLPSPDWGADTAAESENSDDEDICCDKCGHEYCVDIFMNIYEGNIIVTDLKNNKEIEAVHVEEYYMEEDDYSEADAIDDDEHEK